MTYSRVFFLPVSVSVPVSIQEAVYKPSNLDEKQLAKLHTKVGGDGCCFHTRPRVSYVASPSPRIRGPRGFLGGGTPPQGGSGLVPSGARCMHLRVLRWRGPRGPDQATEMNAPSWCPGGRPPARAPGRGSPLLLCDESMLVANLCIDWHRRGRCCGHVPPGVSGRRGSHCL